MYPADDVRDRGGGRSEGQARCTVVRIVVCIRNALDYGQLYVRAFAERLLAYKQRETVDLSQNLC